MPDALVWEATAVGPQRVALLLAVSCKQAEVLPVLLLGMLEPMLSPGFASHDRPYAMLCQSFRSRLTFCDSFAISLPWAF